MLTTEEAYQAANIQYRLNCWVEQINREQQLVVISQGGQFYYDELVLAAGSYAFVPPIPGNDQSHCLVYRTLQDLDAIAQSAAVSKIGVVIGGGLLGLETANALKQLGFQNTDAAYRLARASESREDTVQWMKWAAEHKHKAAMSWFGVYLICNQDKNKGMLYLQQAQKAGDEDASLLLGEMQDLGYTTNCDNGWIY